MATTTTGDTTGRTVDATSVIAAIIEEATAWMAGQSLLSQGRCVDVLLDIYEATRDEFVQWCIAERLSEIRFVNAVAADELRADLAILAALTLPAA